MTDDLRGISDYLAEKISEEIGEDRLIPLDEDGQFAYVDLEASAIYLITIQEARLVPAPPKEETPHERS